MHAPKLLTIYDVVRVKTIHDERGRKIGHDIFVVDVDVDHKRRWRHSAMIGSMYPLLEKRTSMLATR